MMLMVDMGNSTIKWACLEDEYLSLQQRILYQNDTLDQAWNTLDVPSDVWISNVAGPQKADVLSQWIKSHWGLQATFVETSDYACGVKNAYEIPKQLGVDRWLALIGAHQLENGSLCVVDCGTAITLDVLFANGHHQGGLIMPGLTSMHQALLKNTYALDKTLYKPNEQTFLAHNTQTGIRLGTQYAVIGLLEYVINTCEKKQLKLIVTGGSIPAFESLLHIPYRYIPELVLQGLKAVAIDFQKKNDRFNFMTDKMPTIVIVDDSATSVALYQFSIEPLPVNLICFKASEEALSYLQEHQPDLLLLDIIMPGMDGLTLLKQLRNLPHQKETKVIMVTSKDYAQDRSVAKQFGAIDFLIKPLGSEKVRKVICKYVNVKST